MSQGEAMGQKLMSPQALELGAQVLRCLPDIDPTTAQGWIDNPKALKRFLSGMAAPREVRYMERFDAPQQGTECMLSFINFQSSEELINLESGSESFFYCEAEPPPHALQVKLLHFKENVANVVQARKKAHQVGYRLVSADWSLAFRLVFPRPGRLPVAFGGNEAYWEKQGFPKRYFLALHPEWIRDSLTWRPAIIGHIDLTETSFLWAATPLAP